MNENERSAHMKIQTIAKQLYEEWSITKERLNELILDYPIS